MPDSPDNARAKRILELSLARHGYTVSTADESAKNNIYKASRDGTTYIIAMCYRKKESAPSFQLRGTTLKRLNDSEDTQSIPAVAFIEFSENRPTDCEDVIVAPLDALPVRPASNRSKETLSVKKDDDGISVVYYNPKDPSVEKKPAAALFRDIYRIESYD